MKLFDNLYYMGFNDIGAWAITTSDGIILLDTLNSPKEAEEIMVADIKRPCGARPLDGIKIADHRPRALRSLRRRSVFPGTRRPHCVDRRRLGSDRAASRQARRRSKQPSRVPSATYYDLRPEGNTSAIPA